MHFPASFPFQGGLIKQVTVGSNGAVEIRVGEIKVNAAQRNVSGVAGKGRVSIWNNHLASEDTFTPPTKPVLHSFFGSVPNSSPCVSMLPKFSFSGNIKPVGA